MSTPVQNVEQLCGRILRVSDQKMNPIFIDILDLGCYEISRYFISRFKIYKRKNWEIEFKLYDKESKKIIDCPNLLDMINC